MPQFLLSVHVPASGPPAGASSGADPGAMMERIQALEGKMRAADALVSSVRLGPASDATVVDATGTNGSQPMVTDGPYLEAKELIGGFYVVEAETRDAAIDWATETSRAVGMPIEVRPFLDHRSG